MIQNVARVMIQMTPTLPSTPQGKPPQLGGCEHEVLCGLSVTRKNCQLSLKIAKNDFYRKMIYFDTFTKIA